MIRDNIRKIVRLICIAVMILTVVCGCSAEINTGTEQKAKDTGKAENAGGDELTEDVEKEENKEPEAVDGDDEGNDMKKTRSSEVKDSAALMAGVNGFNWKYYDIRDHKSNIFYSPLSLSEALSMALYGAKGNTEKELKDVLGISDTNAFLSDLNALAEADYGAQNKLTVANSLWTDKTFAAADGINEDFVKGLEDLLDAEVKEADFLNDCEAASKEITDWVKDKTEGFIPDYESIANEKTVLDIINAIYFNGKWEAEFMKDDTFEEIFKGEREKSVMMMHMYDESFRYLEKEGFIATELPYKESSLVMDIILPADEEDSGCGESWAKLDDSKKEELLSELSQEEPVKVSILAVPKFDMDLTAPNLKEDLEKLGIRDVFDPSAADFSGIADKMYVSGIAHRARIEVDEEGSKAAAVTEMEFAVTSVGPLEDNRYFICDRPFVYVIKDSKTGVVLFTGLVYSM